jgi:hypothetical protein
LTGLSIFLIPLIGGGKGIAVKIHFAVVIRIILQLSVYVSKILFFSKHTKMVIK